MTINFTEYFERIGAIGGLISDFNEFGNTNAVTDTNNISQYFTGDDLAMIDGFESQQSSAQNAMNSYPAYWQGVAATIVNTMVLNDNPLLTSTNTVASLQELIYQMQQNSQTVHQHLSSFTITPTLLEGNGVCVGNITTPDGLNCQLAFVENVTIECTQDQNTSIGLAGNETFTAFGQVGYAPIAYNYPGGSGASVSTGAINADGSNSFGTLLVNGDFESWTITPNIPDNWESLVGTPGTTILQGSTPYTGTYNLQFVGNGSELTSITQTFGLDTAATLAYGTSYAVNCWVKVSATPAAGVLELSLIDENNNVINNQQGVPNTITKNLTGVSTTYLPVNGIFQLPQIVPTTVKLRISLSTALSAAHTVDVDRIALGPVTTLYAGGPSFAIFSGSIDFYAGENNSTPGDYFTLAVVNARPTNNNTFFWLLDRLYSLKQNNLVFPTSASPTQADTLITT
jgi:hypothetical protein